MKMNMKCTDICLVTNDVPRLRAFYETVFGGKAAGDDFHCGLAVGGMGFTFVHADTLRGIPSFHYASADGVKNVIVSFDVNDVDAEHKRLLALGVQMLNEPTTHPWGARSFQFKDPDGNILNFRTLAR